MNIKDGIKAVVDKFAFQDDAPVSAMDASLRERKMSIKSFNEEMNNNIALKAPTNSFK